MSGDTHEGLRSSLARQHEIHSRDDALAARVASEDTSGAEPVGMPQSADESATELTMTAEPEAPEPATNGGATSANVPRSNFGSAASSLEWASTSRSEEGTFPASGGPPFAGRRCAALTNSVDFGAHLLIRAAHSRRRRSARRAFWRTRAHFT